MKTIKTLTALALAASLTACSGGSSSSVATPSSKVVVPSNSQTSSAPSASPSGASSSSTSLVPETTSASPSAKPSTASSAPSIKTEPADPKASSSADPSSKSPAATSSSSTAEPSSAEPTSGEALKGGSYTTVSTKDAEVTVDFDSTPPEDFDQLSPSYNGGNPLLQGIDQDFAEVTISGSDSDFQVSSIEGSRGSNTEVYVPVSEALARFVLREQSDGTFLTRDGRTLSRSRGLEINAELKRLQAAYPAPEAGEEGTYLFALLPDTSSDFAYNLEFEKVTVNGSLATTRQ